MLEKEEALFQSIYQGSSKETLAIMTDLKQMRTEYQCCIKSHDIGMCLTTTP